MPSKDKPSVRKVTMAQSALVQGQAQYGNQGAHRFGTGTHTGDSLLSGTKAREIISTFAKQLPS